MPYRNNRRKLWGPRYLGNTGYCCCNFPYSTNPNANQRYKSKLKKAEKIDAARSNATFASTSSANAASFAPNCSSSMADVNEVATTIQDDYFDINDNIDHINERNQKEGLYCS
ncbi:hypothetical protein BD408DRAFT_188589 [Parasitella parasitica]|nr:hypothetical protein BD408DRAFT_188589 [Parasitella parasitica]